jgi:hypothetical protein
MGAAFSGCIDPGAAPLDATFVQCRPDRSGTAAQQAPGLFLQKSSNVLPLPCD